jgi:hypothetical protein
MPMNITPSINKCKDNSENGINYITWSENDAYPRQSTVVRPRLEQRICTRETKETENGGKELKWHVWNEATNPFLWNVAGRRRLFSLPPQKSEALPSLLVGQQRIRQDARATTWRTQSKSRSGSKINITDDGSGKYNNKTIRKKKTSIHFFMFVC